MSLAPWTSSQLDDIGRQREDNEQARQALLERWQRNGGEEAPSDAALVRLQNNITGQDAHLEHLRARIVALGQGLEAWFESESVHEVERQIAAMQREAGVKEGGSCLDEINQKIEAVSSALEKHARARTLMDTIETRVRNEQDLFISKVISPLEERGRAFDLGWSPFTETRMALTPKRKRQNVHVDCKVGRDDADLRLSEGQASIKALSFLMAASTSYQWSRWKALILDDPLQYNDLVHKAAFLDLLRPLVLTQGYQVIISTHDLEEAEFIERKCRNADIRVGSCHLLGLGTSGVVMRVGALGEVMPNEAG
jgi:exonuclease SbcC